MKTQKMARKMLPIITLLIITLLLSSNSFAQKAKEKSKPSHAPALTSAGISAADINTALDEAYNKFVNVKEGKNADYIKELAKVGELVFITGEAPEKSAVGIYKGVEIFVPIKDLIDAPKEIARIEKELLKIEEEMGRVFNKLNNASFREKAPPDVIKKNEINYNMLLEKKNKLTESRGVLEGLTGK